MKKNFLSILSCMLVMVNLVSCGSDLAKDILPSDTFTKSDKEDDVPGQFATCDIDTKSLAQVLRKNIKNEITCLEQNLNLFIKIVATERPGSLSYQKLSEFMRTTMADVDEGTIDALGGVFDLSSLIFGDDEGYIKQSNVKPLATLLIELNRIFVDGDVYNLFNSTESVSFFEHNKRKSTVYRSFKELGIVFGKHFVENDKKIDLLKFLLRFESIGNEEIIANAKCLLFLKKAILGGDRNHLTGNELKRATNLFPDFSKVIFDFVNMPEAQADAYQDEEFLKIYREDILTAKKNFFYADQPSEIIFTYEDIEKFVNKFFPEMAEFFKYKDSILKAKEVVFKTRDEDFSSEEIMILLDDVLYKNIDRGVHFYKYYNENSSVLSGLGPIRNGFELKSFVDFQKESSYMFDFNRIVKNYHFFIGDKYLPTFNFDYNRNARGIFEVSFYEDLVQKFFKSYGSEDKMAVFGYSMTLEQLEGAMIELTELFEGEGWITEGRVASTAETITLLSSLFFAQSDGDDKIEVPEFTEFVISMLSSLTISNDVSAEIGKLCHLNEKGTFTGECFRDSFREILKINRKDKKLGEYVPELTSYVNKLSDKDLSKYLTKVASFSRTCPYFANGEERRMTETDGLVTFAGLVAVEQSVVRFDKDKSGILSPEELDEAFTIYKSAVEALVPDLLKNQAKKIFQYMIKYQRVPDVPEVTGLKSLWKAGKEVVHLMKFLFLTRAKNRKSDADRMTFASVLEIIAENSPATIAMLEDDPMFCEKMRDK